MRDVIVYIVNDYDVYNVDQIVVAVDFAFKIGKKMKTWMKSVFHYPSYSKRSEIFKNLIQIWVGEGGIEFRMRKYLMIIQLEIFFTKRGKIQIRLKRTIWKLGPFKQYVTF